MKHFFERERLAQRYEKKDQKEDGPEPKGLKKKGRKPVEAVEVATAPSKRVRKKTLGDPEDPVLTYTCLGQPRETCNSLQGRTRVADFSRYTMYQVDQLLLQH